MKWPVWFGAAALLSACGGSSGDGDGGMTGPDAAPVPLPTASCAAEGGGTTVMAPALKLTLMDRYHEGWLSSPAVADLDGDGVNEIVVARHNKLIAWKPDATQKWNIDVSANGRIWAPIVVADFSGDSKLEVVLASRDKVYMFDAAGAAVSGFPVTWRDEIRSLAAGDVDADGKLEIVTVTNSALAGTVRDIIKVFRGDGSSQAGFPPNTTGRSGCDDNCFVTGGYDQNLAVGPIDGDDTADIVTGQDNAYMSWHRGDGVAFDAATIFRDRKKVLGVRFLHEYALAMQGYANNEATSNQAHFTNTAPAIADIDGDGENEIVMLGSVQNASQADRLRGVGLWVINQDGTRPQAWSTPFHAPDYTAGLWDFDGTNIVAATNQVSVAELDPASPGLEMVFAGFDGRIHLVRADKNERWSFGYTTRADVLTGGVVIADLSKDGVPEIIFNTYSTELDQSALFVLDAAGNQLHKLPLPRKGSMAVPTVADVDKNGTLDIVVSLKDGEDRMRSVLVYEVPGSGTACVLWGTGRGNLLRNGFYKKAN